jgi:lipopolysaccharide transport system ATP-binding protein
VSECVIRVEGLGKCFRGGARHPRRGLHEAVEDFVRAPLRLFRSAPGSRSDGFWALRGISFEVERGDRIGLLGTNGAGKSVLLKILSRVTAPTEGRAEILGHVAPLLEVGAGFHPELTGRENVFFNGTILGMTRDQIREKFHEIVAFSEIEAFIDTPVKLYSSGMRMRLAFSVAVHLEPDILLIDEALAVGDAPFRAKCRRRIGEFIDNGCTLLLVSHDAGVIADLCTRAILIEGGHLIDDGEAGEVLERYRSAPHK